MTTPMAVGAVGLAQELAKYWHVTVLSNGKAEDVPGLNVVRVGATRSGGVRRLLERSRLGRVAELLSLPGDLDGWRREATRAAIELIDTLQPHVVLVQLMPYVDGEIALALRKARPGTRIVLNLEDSPTCPDMHASFPSRWHFRRAARWEDALIEASDATVYVSARTLERVRTRVPQRGERLHLIRCAAPAMPTLRSSHEPSSPAEDTRDQLTVTYTGGMTGWTAIAFPRYERSLLKRLYQQLGEMGTYRNGLKDPRGHSPLYVAQAARRLMRDDPAARVKVRIIGSRFPAYIVERAMQLGGMAGVVNVEGPMPQTLARAAARQADLLFMTLYQPMDGQPCHIMSSKSSEYLQTELPILAALPPGENREFFAGRAGVFITAPDDVDAIAEVLRQVLDAKRAGRPLRFDRSASVDEFTSARRAERFDDLFHTVVRQRP